VKSTNLFKRCLLGLDQMMDLREFQCADLLGQLLQASVLLFSCSNLLCCRRISSCCCSLSRRYAESRAVIERHAAKLESIEFSEFWGERLCKYWLDVPA
jgi:hypothetical protein